jgi:uroporphyrinogen-III synthase
MSAQTALARRTVVVTRPAGQAGHLADLIRAHGGTPVLFPVLEIRPPENIEPALALIDRIEEFQLAIFVSPSAVENAIALIRARRGWPVDLKCAAIGPGSTRALKRLGVTESLVPLHGADSEALLAAQELQDVAGLRIVIFRGEGGRELLGETLKARGAQVHHCACYRRTKPEADPTPLFALWRRGCLDAITATSSEGVRNLAEMVGKPGRHYLRETALFVPHPRIEQAARALGLERVIATAPADEGLIAELVKWFGEIQ